jgi:hypothetical protein
MGIGKMEFWKNELDVVAAVAKKFLEMSSAPVPAVDPNPIVVTTDPIPLADSDSNS